MPEPDFSGYDNATILKAQYGTLLTIAGGMATTAEWGAVALPVTPPSHSTDEYAESNHVVQIHRFRLCQQYVCEDSVNVRWGMHIDGASGDSFLLHDPQTGNMFRIRQSYYLAFVAEGDTLLPVYFATGGTHAIVVKGAELSIVAAVAQISLHQGRLDSVIRIVD